MNPYMFLQMTDKTKFSLQIGASLLVFFLYYFLLKKTDLGEIGDFCLSTIGVVSNLIIWRKELKQIDTENTWMENSEKVLSFIKTVLIVAGVVFIVSTKLIQWIELRAAVLGTYTVEVSGEILNLDNPDEKLKNIQLDLWIGGDKFTTFEIGDSGVFPKGTKIEVPKKFISKNVQVHLTAPAPFHKDFFIADIINKKYLDLSYSVEPKQ